MVDIVRKAEGLWLEWGGLGYTPMGYRSSTYYTVGHVDADNDLVVGGLASLMQREGLVDSLSDGRWAISTASIASCLYAGIVDGDSELTLCSSEGETFYGDYVSHLEPVTLVEVIGVVSPW